MIKTTIKSGKEKIAEIEGTKVIAAALGGDEKSVVLAGDMTGDDALVFAAYVAVRIVRELSNGDAAAEELNAITVAAGILKGIREHEN